MLTKLIDTSQVKLNSMNQDSLEIDLHKRLPYYKHTNKPEGTESFKVTVTNGVYFASFWFKIEYGKGDTLQSFTPLGPAIELCSESLPYRRI